MENKLNLKQKQKQKYVYLAILQAMSVLSNPVVYTHSHSTVHVCVYTIELLIEQWHQQQKQLQNDVIIFEK